jgi:penicillin-binding protein 2
LFGSDNRLPQGRLAAVSYVIVGMILLLLGGFWKLQVIDSNHYEQLAEKNRIRTIPLIAPRGKMLDREGRVIVDNYPSFSVLLLRDDMAQAEQALPEIAQGLGVTLDDLHQQIDAAKFLPKYEPIVIKPEATPADIAFIESHRPDLPMIEMVMIHRRRYPPNALLSSAIGYVGEVNESEIEHSDGKLRPGDMAGKNGLERQYNDVLIGTDGERRVIVNSVGKEMGRLDQVDAVAGQPIQLTVDLDLQTVAEQSLGPRRGAAVALDPRTGEVLAYVSHPAPDPNDFAVRVSKEEWQRLNEDPDKPLMNRPIQAQLPPGSVFKIVMATAMLESKGVPEGYSVFCPGHADFYGRTFHCWQPKGHGEVDLHSAIVHSCDVFFYSLGQRLGIDRISYYASAMGLGKKTGIDLPGEESGLVPSEEWKEKTFHQKWYPGETISVSIGQGAVTTTPLQIAKVIGGIAMGGIFKQPHLLKTSQTAPEFRFPISQESLDKITLAMEDVMGPGGTGYTLRLTGIDICGKSGTAQAIGAQALQRISDRSEHRDDAWFVAFAPRQNPEIVVAVLVDNAGQHGGTAAGPVVRDIIKTYFDKKQGHLTQTVAANAPSGLVTHQALQPPQARAGTADLRSQAAAERPHPEQ